MPTVRLSSDEVHDLPDVCMKCGQPATETVSKTFSWTPSWAGMFGAIGAAMFTKRMTVSAPMCAAHKSHWSMRTIVLLLGFLGVVVLAGVGFLIGMNLDRGNGDAIMGPVCALSMLGLIPWVIVALVLQYTSVRPQQITDSEIQLTGVSRQFVDAVEDQRDRDDEYDDRRRRRRR